MILDFKLRLHQGVRRSNEQSSQVDVEVTTGVNGDLDPFVFLDESSQESLPVRTNLVSILD